MINEETLSRMIEEAARRDERAACAELVRAAGCPCYEAQIHGAMLGQQYSCVDGRLLKHAPCCPEARAAAIEARGVA